MKWSFQALRDVEADGFLTSPETVKCRVKDSRFHFLFFKISFERGGGGGGRLLKGKETRSSEWRGSNNVWSLLPKNENLKTPVLTWTFIQQLMPFWREFMTWPNLPGSQLRHAQKDTEMKTLTRVLAYADDMLMIAPTDEAVKASSWMFEAYVLATGSKISERAALGPLAQARRSRWLAQKDRPSFKWTSWEWKISYFFFFFVSQNSEKSNWK